MENVDGSSDAIQFTQHIDTFAKLIEEKKLWLIFSLGLSKNTDVAVLAGRLFSAGAILGEPRTNFLKEGWDFSIDCFRFRIPDGHLDICSEQYRDRQFTAVLLETKDARFKPTMPLRGKRDNPQDLLKGNITFLRLDVDTIINLLDRLLKACRPPTPLSQSVSIPTCPRCPLILQRVLDYNQSLQCEIDSLIASNADLRKHLERLRKPLQPADFAQSIPLPSCPPRLEIPPQELDDNSSSGDDDEQDFLSCKGDTEEIPRPSPGALAPEDTASAFTGLLDDNISASPPAAVTSSNDTVAGRMGKPGALKRKRNGEISQKPAKANPAMSAHPTTIPSAPPQDQDQKPPSEKNPTKRSHLKGAAKELFEETIRKVFNENPDVLFAPKELLAKINEHPDVVAGGSVFEERSLRDTLRRRIKKRKDRTEATEM